MITKEHAKALEGFRVRAAFGGETKVLTLRGVTPKDFLILADSRGHELLLSLEDVKTLEDARVECGKCGELVNRVFTADDDPETPYCAECYRAWAATQPPPVESCDECGEPGAVYSPRHKVWRCAQCHAKARSFTGSTVEARALQAKCRSADKDSPDHDWKQFKSQWVCRQCEVKVFGKPKFA